MAQGFEDGEQIPLDLVVSLTARIAGAVDCPVSVDLEAGYSDDPLDVASNGRNADQQAASSASTSKTVCRRASARSSRQTPTRRRSRPFARRRTGRAFRSSSTPGSTPFLLKIGDAQTCFDETLNRAAVYASAGASGIFVPFLFDIDLIADLAARIALPLNILVMPTAPPVAALAEAGVARISCGAWPIEALAQAFGAAAVAFADTKDYASVPAS